MEALAEAYFSLISSASFFPTCSITAISLVMLSDPMGMTPVWRTPPSR